MILPEHLSLRRPRSYLPLPVTLSAEGEWEGGQILHELPSPVRIYVFGTLRDVMHWLLLPPERRRSAFAPGAIELRLAELTGAGAQPELYRHLTHLLPICDGGIAEDEVCRACLGVADWARGEGAFHTELAFRQAAALARPHDPEPSLFTARLARDLSQYQRAETWFRRTIKLARSLKNWTIFIRAYLGLAAMYSQLGNGPAARAVAERALLTANRWRLRQLAGEAHHDLFHLCAQVGDLRRAYEHVKNAEINYRGAPIELLARLAGDIATFWVKVGAAQRARPILESVIPLTEDASLRAVWFAQVVRCTAFSGPISDYARVRGEALRAIPGATNLWRRADANLIIAWADLALGAWDDAAEMAGRALELATAIGAVEFVTNAEQALSDATAQRREGALVDCIETPGLSRIADGIAESIHHAVARNSARVRTVVTDAS
jgi:tetratricopeptide (TPR) repeat protein